MIKKTILTVAAVLMGLTTQARERLCFDKDWLFVLGDSAQMAATDYNDSWWRGLDVPHDWPSRATSMRATPAERAGERCQGA